MRYQHKAIIYPALFWLLCAVVLTATAGPADTTGNQSSAQAEKTDINLPELIHNSTEPFTDIASAKLDGLLERIGDSRLVLLGEASHGSAEFYDMRARITRELIENKGFNIIAVEADWPDAETIHHFVLGTRHTPARMNKPFTTFPTWMWANYSVLAFAQWLQDYKKQSVFTGWIFTTCLPRLNTCSIIYNASTRAR